MMPLRAELERLLLKLEDMRFGRSSDRLHEAVLDLKHVLDFHKSLQQPASLPR